VTTTETELDDLLDASTEDIRAALWALARAAVARRPRDRALKGVQAAVGETLVIANLLGRRRVLLDMDAQFAAVMDVPRVEFADAIASILSREPRLAESAEAVADMYAGRYSFAVARSIDEQLTARIQVAIASLIDRGEPAPKAAAVLAEIGEWTQSYADTVYRTNLSTAYTAGRFAQALEPDVVRALPALERYSVRDSAVRRGRREDGGENHLAAHGLVAAAADPIWKTHAPPSGYRCRCGVRMVSATELRRRGLLDPQGRVKRHEPPGLAAFRAHPNFRVSGVV
jgi:hypothetical protein